jgi:hypothetical protein
MKIEINMVMENGFVNTNEINTVKTDLNGTGYSVRIGVRQLSKLD